MIRFLLAILFICFVVKINAQESADTLKLEKVKDTAHSVKKAVIFSAVLPGAGQIYNHLAKDQKPRNAYWKVPLIYAGLGSMTYFFIKNTREVNDLKTEYIARQNNTTVFDKYAPYDQQGVLTLFRQHQSKRDLAILGFVAVYALQVVDAAVEAHFVHFDVSEDLTMRFAPSYFGYKSFGLSMRFEIHPKKKNNIRFAQ